MCKLVPLLLGHPWEYDIDALHHGRSNKYTFMYKGKKITLLHLTPAEIVKSDKEMLASDKIKAPIESEIQHVTNQIKLKILSCLLQKPTLLKFEVLMLILNMCFCTAKRE
jgi:hypothetical protein